MAKPESEVLDLEDRDPENLTKHIEASWEKIFGEPRSIRSPECAWSLSQYCFRFSRLGIYTCLSVLCAPITACIIGTTYAIFYFQYIWCTLPCLRLCRISCGATKSFMEACTHGILIPLTSGCGHLLSQIRVRTGPIEEEKDGDSEKYLIV